MVGNSIAVTCILQELITSVMDQTIVLTHGTPLCPVETAYICDGSDDCFDPRHTSAPGKLETTLRHSVNLDHYVSGDQVKE